jgi:DNA repair protein RecN (Recombination protein N)
MLHHLHIRDYVLVDSLEVAFHPGMSVLSGETGAGKSILVDALSLVLGDRAEAGVVRQGARKAEITASFDLAAVHGARVWLEENGLDTEPGLCLLRRVVEMEGRSRAFINGSVVTLAQLRELGEQLVDIHGQHAHHALLKPSVQRELLDDYAAARGERLATATAWQAWQAARERLQAARAEAGARLLEREGLEAAIGEVTPLLEDLRNWDELQAEHQRQSHMAGLMQASAQWLAGMEDEETGALPRLHPLRTLLLDMTEKDPRLADRLALFDAALGNLEECRHELSRYADRLSLDPEHMADLDQRLAEVLRVSRKHRLAPAELLARHAEWQARLATLAAEQDIESLEAAVTETRAAYQACAARLSARRRQAAGELEQVVTQAMSELALGDGRFAVSLTPVGPHAHGVEDVAFLVASHASLALGPLEKVASGGELSRISLAIQTARSGQENVPTMIFDEVDVGIGGRVAEAVGRRLAQLAINRQVLVITHLPQVAACGHHHLRVSKLAGADKVISQVEALDGEERVREIARMLGGRDMTEITLKHAREMLSLASADRSGKGRKRSA